MRWAQLVLVENDPGRVDLAFWLDYFRRVHADAACLSAGGIVAYYPTDIPFHHRSAWLGTSDPFGELVRGCRAMRMKVIARTDPHATRDDTARAHPDWIAVDADGRPRRHWANPELWVTCALGPYNFEFMTAVHREIVSRYDIDGIFTNRWANQTDCYCEHCRRNFRAASGADLPRSSDAADPIRRAVVAWRKARLTELWALWDADIRRTRPGACFVPNGPPDMRTAGLMQAPIQFADHQARRGLTPPYSNGRRGKEYHAVMDGRPVGGIFSVGVEEPHRWKDSVQSEAEIRLWVASGTAQGMRPWFAKFAGVLRDRRWLPVVERIYDWHHRHERYLRNTRSLARVALLFSEQTAAASAPRPSGRSPITSPACTTRWSRRACRSTSCTRRSSRPMRSTGMRSSCWPTRRRCRTPSARRSAPTWRAAAACWRRSRARATTSPARGGPTSASATCSASATPAASRAR